MPLITNLFKTSEATFDPEEFAWTPQWVTGVDAAEKPIVIVPFLGEFGHFVMSFVPACNALGAPEKIVCCQPGEEHLFPSCDSFFLDWRNPFSDEERACIRNEAPVRAPLEVTAEEKVLYRVLTKEFPDHTLVRLDWPLDFKFAITSMPIMAKREPTKKYRTDIVFSARQRFCPSDPNARVPRRNYPHWNEVISGLRSEGLIVGHVGLPDTLADIESDLRAWDFNNARSATIQMMQNSRLFLGTDSGTTHLAAVLGVPIVAFRRPDGGPNILRRFTEPMARHRGTSYSEVSKGWDSPKAVIEQVLREFKRADG